VDTSRLVDAVAQDDLERLQARIQALAQGDVPDVVAKQVEVLLRRRSGAVQAGQGQRPDHSLPRQAYGGGRSSRPPATARA
jgi:hypothetical protein